jgi:virginiamycin B lyase
MQAHAKVWFVSAALMTLSGCAGSELEQPSRKPLPRTSGAGGGLYDYMPNGSGGTGGQSGKGGAAGLAGSAGRANGGGGATGTGGSNVGAANAAGSGGTAAGAAGASSSASCPSLTLARARDGACVPRVTEYDVAETPTSIVLGADRTIWVDDDGRDQLVQLDKSGRVIGRVDCDAGSSPRALVGGTGDTILWYTDTAAKTLVRVAKDKQKSATGLGFAASALAPGPDGEMFLSEFGKAFYWVQPSESTTTRWDSSPTDAIVVTPDNNVWFSQGSALSQLIPGAGVTDFVLSDTAYASGLCVGADSGLWFSDGFASQLVRVSLDGVVSRSINLPTGTSPGRIITGPDGAFWFAETGTSMIGRVTLQGEITHYPLPTPNGLPLSLTVGPDDNIWFTEPTAHKVGRLIPDPSP